MPACSFVWRNVETAGLGLKIFISWYVQLWMLLMKPDANAERVNRPLARGFPENNTLMDAHWIIFGTQFSHHPRTESGNWTSQKILETLDDEEYELARFTASAVCKFLISVLNTRFLPYLSTDLVLERQTGKGCRECILGSSHDGKWMSGLDHQSTSWHHYSTVLVVRMSGESVFASRRLMYNRINNRIYHIEWLSRFPLRERLAQLINRALTVDVQIVLNS
jgi:hypothetical protein